MSNFGIAFTIKRHIELLAVGGLVFTLVACQSRATPPQNGRLQLHGIIVSVEKSEHSVVVKHDEIPGYMAAMTMPYEVADGKDLDRLSPGTEIRADVIVNEGSTRLENIRVIKKGAGQGATL